MNLGKKKAPTSRGFRFKSRSTNYFFFFLAVFFLAVFFLAAFFFLAIVASLDVFTLLKTLLCNQFTHATLFVNKKFNL